MLLEDTTIQHILELGSTPFQIQQLAKQRKLRVIIGRVKSVKIEPVNIHQNRELLSFTEEEQIAKVQLEEIKLAVGFENHGLSLKFDDFSECN